MPTGNTQQIINYGATANDGQGDQLRTAFIKTDENFDNIWLAGPAGSNVRITNNTIGILNTNGNLILSPNGVGVIQTNNNVVPRANRTYDLGSANLQYRTVYANAAAFQAVGVAGDLSVGGNLTVQGNIIQVGNIVTETLTIQLANAVTTANAANGSGITVGASDNIATLLYNSASNIWTTNIGVSATGNVTSPYFIGNGSQLTGITSSYGNSNVTTLLGNLGSNVIGGTGNITTTANISGGFILGNISQANGFPATYGNANVANYLPTFSGNISAGNVSATGNISGAYVKGNGSELTNLPAPAVTQDITSNGAMSIMTYDGVIKYVNYATVEPSSGNIAGGNISATGNILGNYVLGNGSQLTGISTANTGNVTFNDVNIIGTGNLNLQPNGASSEYLNIFLTGSTDIHVAAGNGSGNVILGTDEEANIAILQGGNVAIQAGNVAGTKAWAFDTAGNLTLPRGGIVYETNIPDGGLNGNTIALAPSGGTSADQQLLIYPTTNDANHLHLTSGNLYSTELFLGDDNLFVKLANTGNVVINSNDGVGNTAQWTFGANGNLTVPGGIVGSGASPAPYLSGFSSVSAITVSASGNVTGNYFIGNGSQLTGLPSTYGNADVANFLAAYGSNSISTTGNITANNFIGNGAALTNVTVSVAGNIVGTSSNVSLVAGSYTMTFDNTGLLTLPTMGGDEGGEINLGIPVTNTTLQNRVAIDVFQDRIRFFEGSANAKGVYIDLAQSSAGVGTLLNNRVSGLVNAGTFVTMDLIKATVTTTGNRGLSLATTTGTLAYSIGGTYGMATPASGGSAGTGTLTTTPTASIFNWGFLSTGDISTYILTDTTNSRAYRITLQIGASFNNNMISIERLI